MSIYLSVYLSTYLSVCHIKNEAILRAVLQKWKVECRADGLVPFCLAFFPLHVSKLLRLPRKSDARVIRSAAPVTQNHLSKPEDLRLQNATPLRKSALGPPNSSDEHVSCAATATENTSLQILFKCPTPAIFLEMLQNPHVLLTFDTVHNPLRLPCETTSECQKVVRSWGAWYILTLKCASRDNGVHFFDISTSKSGPDLVRFVHVDFEMCFASQRRAIFHLSSAQRAPHPRL